MKFRVFFLLFVAYASQVNAQLRELSAPMTQAQINSNNEYKLDQYKVLLKDIQSGKKPIPADKPDFEQAITNTIAWLQLLTGDFKGAEKVLKKGMKKDTNYEYFKSNLPPALLFQGKYEDAKKMYAELKNTEMKAVKKPFKEVFLEDLSEIEKTGLIPTEYQENLVKIRAFLKE